jgi:hypothetical protein
MKGKFTLMCACVATLLSISSFCHATVWRINNTAGATANFTQLNDAMASPLVLPGDTIYLEGSSTNYASATLTKKLVIIGPGYLLSGTNGNPGLQANTNTATIQINIDSTGSGSKIMGITVNASIDSPVDDFTFERCDLSIIQWRTYVTGQMIQNLRVNKCLLGTFRFTTYQLENTEITNCIFQSGITFNTGRNSLIRNCSFQNITINITNTYFSNNIISGVNFTHTSCTLKNNLSTGNNLPAGSGNLNNVPSSSLFVGTGSTDGRHMLPATSPARNAGETINGITPHCGPFGTDDPYRLSGIPPIPAIYELTVPVSVPNTSSSMNIIISTRSNN